MLTRAGEGRVRARARVTWAQQQVCGHECLCGCTVDCGKDSGRYSACESGHSEDDGGLCVCALDKTAAKGECAWVPGIWIPGSWVTK